MTRRRFLERAAAAAALGAGGPALLSACGDDGGDDGGGDASGGTRTVVVWDRAGAEATARQAFLTAWNEGRGAELGITVQYEPQATDKYEEIVRTAFQTQRGPDIFHGPSSILGQFVGAGWIQPLRGLISDDVLGNADAYLRDSSELVWGGEPYGVPTTTFTIRNSINRGLFQAAGLDPDDPPTTFSAVLDAARAITAAGGGDAFGIALPTAWVGFLAWIVDPPVLASNPDLTQLGLFDRSSGEFAAENYEPVVELYRALVQEEIAYPGAETLNSDTVLGAFAEGKIGMYLSSGSIVGGLQNLGAQIDFGVGPIPVADGQTQRQSPMNAGFPYSISSTIEDEESVAAVFEVLVGAEMQQALADGGVPPLSTEAWDSDSAMGNDWLQLFRPADLDTQWPKKPGSVVAVEGEDVTTTITKLILDPSQDAPSTLADLSERYQRAFETGVDNGEIDPDEFRV
ncbi:extracellular solute-binding protein [Jiangella aurantiaca]|uniref:Extracellular solute-binding protein n=1 Tax=Jiangella aurantiaca TaxID=2530373 RepID=A0A4R5A9G3_9ACTN|nr:extracellular solute-binding protein [Jiangella aurantiaca]TDD68948.1 extracellular solute-binding protein [Jiangella aurantiaca]